MNSPVVEVTRSLRFCGTWNDNIYVCEVMNGQWKCKSHNGSQGLIVAHVAVTRNEEDGVGSGGVR